MKVRRDHFGVAPGLWDEEGAEVRHFLDGVLRHAASAVKENVGIQLCQPGRSKGGMPISCRKEGRTSGKRNMAKWPFFVAMRHEGNHQLAVVPEGASTPAGVPESL